MHNSFDAHTKLMRLADCVVAVSESDRKLLAVAGFSSAKLAMVHNGPLGSPRYGVKPPPRNGLASHRIASVSGLHPRKGVDDLLRAFATAAADHPEWSLLVAGEGPDGERLAQLANSLGIEARVEFRGKVSEPLATLSEADVFVTAAHAEPFGLSAVEARAAGCAVIATRVGGLPEVLANGEAGLLVEPGDPVGLAAALKAVIEDANLRADLQRRALKGLEQMSSCRMAKDYRAIYSQVIAARKGAAPR